MSKYEASIIIVSLLRHKSLIRCLHSIFENVKGINYEVIVLIDKITEIEAKEKLRNYYDMDNMKLDCSTEKRGRVRCRNIGIKMANSPIVVFIDDDVVVTPGWLNEILKYYRNENVVGVGGSTIKFDKNAPLRQLWFLIHKNKTGSIYKDGTVISNFTPKKKKIEYVDCLPGANMSFRKKNLLDVGGFDTFFDRGDAFREETDLSLRIGRYGSLIFNPKALVYHFEESEGRENKKESYYYRNLNNTYFFIKNIYNGGKIQWAMYIIKNFISSIFLSFLEKSPHPILQFKNGIKDCVKLMDEKLIK